MNEDIATLKKLLKNKVVQSFIIGIIALAGHEVLHLAHLDKYNGVLDQLLSDTE